MKFWTNVKQYGNSILYVGYENGNRIQKKIAFNPTLYLEDNSSSTRANEYKSYNGDILKKIEFDSIKDAKEFIEVYKDVDNFNVYGTNKFASEYIGKEFPEANIQFQLSDIRTFYLDIECTLEDGESGFPDPHEATGKITAVTIYDSKTEKYIVFGIHNYDKTKTYKNDPIADIRDKIIWNQFGSEKEMLWGLLEYFQKNPPDILTGWYSESFDIPYIVNRIKRIFGKKVAGMLSPWGIIQEKKSNIKRFGMLNEESHYDIFGIAGLDLLDLYKKYSGSNEESYKLDYIAEKNLGINKIPFEGSLHDLYINDYQKYMDYNIQDVNILVRLEEKRKFLDLIIEVSYIAKVPCYTDSLGTVKYWETFVYNHLLQKKQLSEIKNNSNIHKTEKYAGAFVKDPILGFHKYIVSFDFASLYPSLIRQINIGPETLVDQNTLSEELKELISNVSVEKILDKSIDLSLLKKYNYSLSANGQLYKRDQISFPAEICGHLFESRKIYKNKMLETEKEVELIREEIRKRKNA